MTSCPARRAALVFLFTFAGGCATVRGRSGAAVEPGAPEAPEAARDPIAGGMPEPQEPQEPAGASSGPAQEEAEAPAPPGPADEPPGLGALRERILAAARSRLGTRPRLDCVTYVLAAYRAAGVGVRLPPGRSAAASLLGASRGVEAPRPGDLAFFRDTYDRNRDGRVNDPLTHVALVEAVDGSGVVLLHRGGRVQRIRMDLTRPGDRERNDAVRRRRRRDVPGTRYLAGELFTGFGALLGGEFTSMLQTSRAPVTRARHPARRHDR